MKKAQRNFSVEYKSSRRKTDSKINSIWGNMDLKSVARDVEESAMPFFSTTPKDSEPAGKAAPSEGDAKPSPTAIVGKSAIVPETEEAGTGDESETRAGAHPPAVLDATTVQMKKRRSPAPKASSEIASVEAADNQKRRLAAKPIAGADTAKRLPLKLKRAPEAAESALAQPAGTDNKMADLLQLDEENRRLRKLLVEKLRAENADLRKRLKLD